MTMTDDELAELEHLANAATAGPWEYTGGPMMVEFGADAEFISAARTTLSRCIAEIRLLRTRVAALQRLHREALDEVYTQVRMRVDADAHIAELRARLTMCADRVELHEERLALVEPVVEAAKEWRDLPSFGPELRDAETRLMAKIDALLAAERLNERAAELPDPGTGLLATKEEP